MRIASQIVYISQQTNHHVKHGVYYSVYIALLRDNMTITVSRNPYVLFRDHFKWDQVTRHLVKMPKVVNII